MDWLKKNYEKVALGVVAILVLAIAAFVALQAQDFTSSFGSRNSAKPPNNKIEEPPIAAVESAAKLLASPPVWTQSEGSPFVSRTYILKGESLIDPLEGDVPLHPPVDNAWIMKFNLDPADQTLLAADPDNDKFTVLEEWNAKTDPTDDRSLPPYYTKLRLKEFVVVPFRLKFTTPDEGQTFSINTIDRRSRTQFLKIGEMIQGTPYKLVKYLPKKETDANGVEKDVSTLELENMENGDKVSLLHDKVVDSPSSYGVFDYLYDGSNLKIKRGDTFSLPQDEQTKFKLIDISKADAVIENLQTQERVRVLPTQVEVLPAAGAPAGG